MDSAEGTRKILREKSFECYLLMQERTRQEEAGNVSFSGWCPVAWDDIMCWDRAAAGTIIVKPCPDYVPKFKSHEFAVRTCHSDGTWEQHRDPTKNRSWTNYTACFDPPNNIDINYHTEQADKLTLLYTVGYSVSLATLVIAMFIMLYCRRLQCKSNTMHINLFLAFIMRASLSFLKDRLFVGHLGLAKDITHVNGRMEFIEEGLHWECRLITVLFMFAISATQTWILMEGLYLYMLIHRTIITERYGVRPYMLIGWTIPWVIVIPWIIVKYLFENTFCWNMQENEGYFWMLKGPWIATVLINFFFFLDIFRVLFMRVRSNHRHVGSSKYRKFAKFILVLIPLFGIMYIVLFVAFPSEVDDGEFNVVYLYIEMGYNSFQGFILALLFCFLNEDVHSELRRMWRRHRSRREDSKYLNRSLAGSTFRQVSRDTSSPNPTRPTKASWRMDTMSKCSRSSYRKPNTTKQDTASSPGNVSSLGERHPLCIKHSSGSLPLHSHNLSHSPSIGSVSSDCGSRVKGSDGGDGAGEGPLLVQVGNGTGGGVPAKIILLNSRERWTSDESSPLTCKGDSSTSGSSSVSKNQPA
ncbi:secretin receptor-like [Littorina saxatilis]|uniref:secretin receptor-like n=1 Tax=Littorina saxatilis TaxID=31220 RepID=UPI0038B4514B